MSEKTRQECYLTGFFIGDWEGGVLRTEWVLGNGDWVMGNGKQVLGGIGSAGGRWSTED